MRWLLLFLLACGGSEAVTIEVVHTGDGDGFVSSEADLILCGARCSTMIPHGSMLELQAAAGEGSRFSGWSAPCDHTQPICSLQPLEDVRIEARFDRN